MVLESLKNVEFQTLLIENGNIFLGATNAILQFNDDLSLLHQFKTGPATDGESCIAPQYCNERSILCAGDTQCFNNYNTLLLTYRDRLLACGTLHETCDLLMLGDITTRFGNKLDLQCPVSEPIRKKTQITRRNRSLSVVAATYLNNMRGDNDLLYLGRSPDPIDTLIAPSLENSYFSSVDSSATYLAENNRSRQAIYHFAWTDDEYAYVLWTNATNNELKLTRYCHEVTSTLSRSDVEDTFAMVELFQGRRTYTEITLQCHSNGNLATDVVEAKVAFNTLYVLFRNNSNNVAEICSSTIQSFNENFDFVRSQCWNSTNSENVANTIAVQTSCSLRPDFSNEWVSMVQFAFWWNATNRSLLYQPLYYKSCYEINLYQQSAYILNGIGSSYLSNTTAVFVCAWACWG